MKTKIFQLLNNEIELADETGLSKLYVNSDTKTIRYITTSLDGDNHRYYESDMHPSELTDKQRHEILNYCLSSFDSEEVVNFNDLFMHHEYIAELSLPNDYTLTDEWYTQKKESNAKPTEVVSVNILELASELADMELKLVWGETRKGLYEDEESCITTYSDEAQDIFNDLYDKYYSLIESIQEV